MCRRPGCCATAATTACGWGSTCSCWRGVPCLAAGSSGFGAVIAGCSRWGSTLRPEPAMQITAQMQVGRVGAVQQLLFDHLLFVGLGLEGLGHVIVEYPYPGHVAAVEPGLSYPLLYLPRIQWLLWRQAPTAHAGQLIALQLAELALDQILVDQRIAVVEGQRQGAARAHQRPQVGQSSGRVAQPLQYRMADNQIMTLPPFGQPLQWQVKGVHGGADISTACNRARAASSISAEGSLMVSRWPWRSSHSLIWPSPAPTSRISREIGRASCRERV